MSGQPEYSGQIAYEIDKEVQRIIKEQYERCKQILTEHESQLRLIAETLLTEETLVAEQIQSLFHEGHLPVVNYDDAKVVERNGDDDFDQGKYGKSYDEIRREQEELTNRSRAGKSERREDESTTQDGQDASHDTKQDEAPSEDTTGYEEEPKIDRPGEDKPPH